MLLHIKAPVIQDPGHIEIGTAVEISGIVYTARDAIMPKIARLIKNGEVDTLPVSLQGAVIMHTAFSPAGFGPTSSNKEEIESNMGILSEAGVRIHIGKGALKNQTVEEISKYGSIFVVVPSLSALLQSKLVSKRVVAYEEEGMEAMHELVINGLSGIVAAAHGKSLFKKDITGI
jgi:fumarate hydratase subunit beta